MSAQGLEVIDHTVHLTHEWINELAARLGWVSKRASLRLLRATLQHLRDQLEPGVLAGFSAQLPLLIRGFLFEGWDPKHVASHPESAEDFLGAISAAMDGVEEFRGRADIGCVFDLLTHRLSIGEVREVRASLAPAICDLWPEP